MSVVVKTLSITAAVCGLVASVCSTLGRGIELVYNLKEGNLYE